MWGLQRVREWVRPQNQALPASVVPVGGARVSTGHTPPTCAQQVSKITSLFSSDSNVYHCPQNVLHVLFC